ncbi:MAG: hypothetical protein AB1938_07985 [Myxococcota bacterium]
MQRLAVTLGLLVAASGCMGVASEFPEELAIYDFTATVAPAAGNQAGGAVQVSLEVTSRSNIAVLVDVVLKVSKQNGDPVAERHFTKVLFHPEEIWVLVERFLPGASDRGALNCEVIVYAHESGEELWRSPAPTSLVVQ